MALGATRRRPFKHIEQRPGPAPQGHWLFLLAAVLLFPRQGLLARIARTDGFGMRYGGAQALCRRGHLLHGKYSPRRTFLPHSLEENFRDVRVHQDFTDLGGTKSYEHLEFSAKLLDYAHGCQIPRPSCKMAREDDNTMTMNSIANLLESGSDELEKLAIEECIKRQRVDRDVSVLILPSARCELAGQFASLGARVCAGDTPEMKQDIEGRILAGGWKEEIRFVPYVLPELPPPPQDKPYDIIVLRRGLCHLPYEQARLVIRDLLRQLRIGGKLYLSILGLHSELGEEYPDAELPIGERFAPLAPEVVEKYGIQGNICLYTERDLFLLLLSAGASVLRTMTTTYGSVRGVAMRV